MIQFELLKNNPNNPRTIKNKKFDNLVEKIKNFPQMLAKRPIVYDSSQGYIILGGNRRRDAVDVLLKRGEIELKPEYFADGAEWTPEQKREFIVTDNVADGDWDWDKLANQYEAPELKLWNLDLPAYFDEDDSKEDNPPDVSDDPAVSQYGKVYQLGSHRVMCGNATFMSDVAYLMGDKKADMIFTDPPYNVDYEGKTKDKLKIENDKKEDGHFYDFLLLSFQNTAAAAKAGAAIYVCHADLEGINFRRAFVEAQFLLKSCLIWNKQSMVLGRADYQWKHEPILYGWKDGGAHKWFGARNETTVWDINRPSRSSQHPTMKPIALVSKALQNSSEKGNIVIDFFLGSGSTLIACEQDERICYGMELDPKYVDVIRRRYWMLLHDGKDDGWEAGTPAL